MFGYRKLRGDGEGVLQHFLVMSTYFIKGRSDLPGEAVRLKGSNCFSRGVRTRISMETYCHL